MSITLEELRRLLGNDEPDYPGIAVMVDESAADHLRALAADDNLMLAQKAVYLASLVEGERTHAIVEEASRSDEKLLRIASASALANLPADTRNRIADQLLDDGGVSVQKLTLRALGGDLPPSLRQKVDGLSTGSSSPLVRDLSQQKLDETR
jgi:hypothetical protein